MAKFREPTLRELQDHRQEINRSYAEGEITEVAWNMLLASINRMINNMIGRY
jgi:hypothetical protein